MDELLYEKSGGTARALALGLVNTVVPAAELTATVDAWVARIGANAPLAIRPMKRLYRHGLSEDFGEDITAFIERRAPQFTGR